MNQVDRQPGRLAKVLFAFVAGSLLAAFVTPAVAAPETDRSRMSQQEIDRLIERLGDESYDVREAAQRQLAAVGFDAYEALEAATGHEDLEIATRAKYLLQLIRVWWTQDSDPPEVRDLLKDYEFQPGEERLERIRRLGGLPGMQGIGPLCRLVRFEGSELFSKYAALEILDRRPADEAGRELWAATLKQNLPRASRPAARWVYCYLKLQQQPREAVDEWAQLVQAEQALAGRLQPATSIGLVAALLYCLAEAQADQGQEAEAENTATRARALIPGADLASAYAHWENALRLQRRGRFRWAEAEYRRTIESEVPEFQVRGRIVLAEMKHDQGDHLGAGQVLEETLQGPPQPLQIILARMEQSPASLRARAEYFYACHWEEQGDRQKQRVHLDKAIESDPAELDTLIALYKLADVDPEHRRKTLELIAKAAAALRRGVEAVPDDPTDYNQFAWLVGNTEGDAEEALRCARKAVELSPTSGAYHDTLAHVYFGRGDYRGAVEHQERAAELEPHSGLIAKQLKLFRQKLAESKGGESEPSPAERHPGPAEQPPQSEP